MSFEYTAKEALTYDEAMDSLNALVGLTEVKKEVRAYFDMLKSIAERKKLGLPTPLGFSHHLILKGNFGTGKTTVARIMGQMYKSLGILETGNLLSVERDDLVAGYIGQTAAKTESVVKQAFGGILYIDNASELDDGNHIGFGTEAVETLHRCIEEYSDKFIVILAGNAERLDRFTNKFPFLEAHFPKAFEFKDYDAHELLAIFKTFGKKCGLELEPAAEAILCEHFKTLCANRQEHYCNANTARNILQRVFERQALRLNKIKKETPEVLTKEALSLISAEDVSSLINYFLQ